MEKGMRLIVFLFHQIKKCPFNLLCVLDLFFRMLAVNSVSDFFFSFLGKSFLHSECVVSAWIEF